MLIKCVFLSFVQLITCQPEIESFIVGGQDAQIEQHPHSAYLGSSCTKEHTVSNFRCGASILNQWILLTAAHCFECNDDIQATVSVGSAFVKGEFMTSAHRYIIHPHYKHMELSHDIALVKLKRSLPLSSKVSRVALMSNPPHNEMATVAGWGLVNEFTNTGTNYLKFVRQKVMSRVECLKILGNMPVGCLCAGTRNGQSYASLGDSGGALIIRGFIQIGLVAYKNPAKSRSVVVYTDTGFFYNWILANANSLYCE